MIERFVRHVHFLLKKAPGLRRLDAWATTLWFEVILRWISEIDLVSKLAFHAVLRRKKLVVLSRFGGIGDIICCFPAVQEFARRQEGREVVFLTQDSYHELVERSALTIKCLTISRHTLPPRWASWLVEESIPLHYEDEFEQGGEPRGSLLEQFGRALGFDRIDEAEARLKVDPAEVGKIRTAYLEGKKKRLILLHTGPTWAVREWPREKWTELTARLKENPDNEVLQIVADRNVTLKHASCAEVPGATPVRVADRMGGLIDTVAAADLLIGIDSGPMHVAAATSTPCVAIFGPTDPLLRLWKASEAEGVVHRLDCSFCHHRRPRLHWQTGCPFDIACMKLVTVDQVWEKVRKVLAEPSTLVRAQ